jgi:GT2 family glycosyltransferase
LDAYFAPAPGPGVAVLAGAIEDVADGQSVAARHSVGRAHMSARMTLERDGTPYAQTANCAIRRAAFVAAGGFDERARAGEDADLCFRLLRDGWTLERRPAALVRHRARRSLRGLLAQLARHGSGAAWLNRRYPGEFPPPPATELVRRIGGRVAAALRAVAARDRGAAALALVEALTAVAFELGRLLPNRARSNGSGS